MWNRLRHVCWFYALHCVVFCRYFYTLTAWKEVVDELPMYKTMHALEYGVLHTQMIQVVNQKYARHSGSVTRTILQYHQTRHSSEDDVLSIQMCGFGKHVVTHGKGAAERSLADICIICSLGISGRPLC